MYDCCCFCVCDYFFIPKGTVSRCADDEIRLFSVENPRDGRVQVCIDGSWVQVCIDGWMEGEAQVACRQLGYSARGVFERVFKKIISNTKFFTFFVNIRSVIKFS